MIGNMRPLDAVLPAGEWVTLPGPGDKIFPAVLVGDLEIEFYDDSGTRFGSAVMAVGDGGGPGPVFRFVRVKSATAQTVRLMVTLGEFSVSRIAGQVEVAGVVETAPDYSRVLTEKAVFRAGLSLGGSAGVYAYLQLWNGGSSNVIITDLVTEGESVGQVGIHHSTTELTSALAPTSYSETNSVSAYLSAAGMVHNANVRVRRGHSSTVNLSGVADVATRFAYFRPSTNIINAVRAPDVLVVEPGAGVAVHCPTVNQGTSLNVIFFEEAG